MSNGNSYENPQQSDLTYKRTSETVADDSIKETSTTENKNPKKLAIDQAKSTSSVQDSGLKGVKKPLLREAIASVIPEGNVRQKMLSKAEKKRERLDAKFGKPGNREYTSKDGNAISGDGDKINKVAQGKRPSYLDEEGKPLQKILRKGDHEYTSGLVRSRLNRINGKPTTMGFSKDRGAILTDFGPMFMPQLKSIPKEEMEKSKKKYIKATKRVAKGDLREARKDRRKARKG